EMTSTLEALALRHATDAARRTAIAWSDRAQAAELIARNPSLWSASGGFGAAVREGLGAWMRAIVDDVRSHAGRKRAVAQVAALAAATMSTRRWRPQSRSAWTQAPPPRRATPRARVSVSRAPRMFSRWPAAPASGSPRC